MFSADSRSYTRDSSNFPRCKLVSKIFSACMRSNSFCQKLNTNNRKRVNMKVNQHTGTHVPTRISAPAAARDFAIAQPYPLSSAIPAMNALFPEKKTQVDCQLIIACVNIILCEKNKHQEITSAKMQTRYSTIHIQIHINKVEGKEKKRQEKKRKG